MKNVKNWIVGLVAVVMSLALIGCNTMEGAGEDIESGGQAIQDAAD